MNYSFRETLPAEITTESILISGRESLQFAGRDYLIIEDADNKTSAYEIRYQVHCSPFKEAIVTNNILAVGHEEHFYLFNLALNTPLLQLKMISYFGHLYSVDNLFIVTSAGGLYSVSNRGNINWQNLHLGIDGVIVNEITGDKIYGSGEWDPPGGWQDFVLDKKTGIPVK